MWQNSLVTVIGGIGVLYLILKFFEYEDNKQFTSHQSLVLSASTNINIEEINKLLDDFIIDTLNTYLILNISYKENDFIGQEKEEKIKRDVCKLVIERISPFIISKLSLMYNLTVTEETNTLTDIIAEHAEILINNYIMANNRPKQ